MQASRITLAVAIAVLSCGWLTLDAIANDAASPDSPAATLPPLKASVKLEGGEGMLPTYVANISAGTNKFGFILPDDFHLGPSDTSKLTLVSADHNSIITWRIVAPALAEGEELDAATFRARVTREHPGAKILAEFSQAAHGRSGPAFEVRWSGGGGLERKELAVFIPTPYGVVEYELDSSLEKYGAARQHMSTALLTLRWNDEHGKIAVPVYSNRL